MPASHSNPHDFIKDVFVMLYNSARRKGEGMEQCSVTYSSRKSEGIKGGERQEVTEPILVFTGKDGLAVQSMVSEINRVFGGTENVIALTMGHDVPVAAKRVPASQSYTDTSEAFAFSLSALERLPQAATTLGKLMSLAQARLQIQQLETELGIDGSSRSRTR